MNINNINTTEFINELIQITPEAQHQEHRNFYTSIIGIMQDHMERCTALGAEDKHISYIHQSILTVIAAFVIASYPKQQIELIRGSSEELTKIAIETALMDYEKLGLVEGFMN